MSDLLTRAEIIKLARELRVRTDHVSSVESLGAEKLRHVRGQISQALFDEHSHKFERLAAIARMLPTAVAAVIVQWAFGPLIAARVASLLPPPKAAEIALKLPVSFLCDICVLLDPRSVPEVIVRIPVRTVVDVAHELVRREDYVTIARFAELVTDEQIRAVVDSIPEDETLLRIGFYIELPQSLDRIIELLRPERLRALVHTAMTGSTELELASLSLMSRVSDEHKTQLGDLAAEQEDAVLGGYLDTAVREKVVADLLAVVGRMSPSSRVKFANVSALTSPATLGILVDTAVARDLWAELLPVVEQMTPVLQHQVAELAQELDEDALSRLAQVATERRLWPVVLGILVEHMNPAAQVRLALLPVFAEHGVLEALVRTAVEHDLWAELLPVAQHMDDDVQRRMVELIEDDQDTLSRLAEVATQRQLWPSLLSMLAEQDAAVQERIADVWRSLDTGTREAVEQQAHELGLDEALAPLRKALA